MVSTFRYEIFRIFSKKNIFILLIMLSTTFIFIYIGNNEYKSQLREVEHFKLLEEQKIGMYNTMEQYAATGFNILFRPGNLSVFFVNFNFIHNLKAVINSSEMLIIYNERKGNKSFVFNENFSDFAHLILIFATFFATFLGINNYRTKNVSEPFKGFTFISTTLSRLILLGLIFTGVFLISFLMARIMNVPFSGNETKLFLYYLLFSVLLLGLFFCTGILLSSVFKNRKKAFIIMPVVWFVMIYLVPGVLNLKLSNEVSNLDSSEELNHKKLTLLLKAERRYKKQIEEIFGKNKNIKRDKLREILKGFVYDLLNNEYVENTRKENDFHARVKDVIKRLESRAVYYPIDYFKFLSYEMSGNGYSQYANFVDYVYDIRDRFYRFYVKKRYDAPDQAVESFIKGDENVYRANSSIPGSFRKASIVTVIYALVLFLAAFIINFVRAQRRKKDIFKIDIKTMLKGKNHFRLCENQKERKQICNYLQNHDAVVIEKIDHSECDRDISLIRWLEYECCQLGVDTDEVIKELSTVEVTKFDLKNTIKYLSPETLDLAYLTTRILKKSGIYVLNNFLSGVSKGFENKFRQVIKRIDDHAVCLYLGEYIYERMEPEPRTSAKSRFVVIDFDTITLR